jgi:hypothetical protein
MPHIVTNSLYMLGDGTYVRPHTRRRQTRRPACRWIGAHALAAAR